MADPSRILAVVVAGGAGAGLIYALRELRTDLHAAADSLAAAEAGFDDPRIGPPPPRASLRLLQAQVFFRHGARLPYHDITPRVRWPEAGTDAKSQVLHSLGGTIRPQVLNWRGEEVQFAELVKPTNSDDVQLDRAVLSGDGEPVQYQADLTSIGMQQAFELGQRLRLRYSSSRVKGAAEGSISAPKPLLSFPVPNPVDQQQEVQNVDSALEKALEEQILVRTTRTRRTVETATGVLSGLVFGDRQPANDTTPASQLAPTATITATIHLNRGPEWMVANNFQCDRLKHIMEAGFAVTHDAKLLGSEASSVLEDCLDVLGSNFVSKARLQLWGLVGLFDPIVARHTHDKPLPAGVDDSLRLRLEKAAARQMFSIFSGIGIKAQGCSDAEARLETLRLCSGRALHHILVNMEDACSVAQGAPIGARQDEVRFDVYRGHRSSNNTRLLLYSGHDWTLMPLLAVLCPGWGAKTSKMYSEAGKKPGEANASEEGLWIPYAADVSVELFVDEAVPSSSKERFFVRVMYCGRPLPLQQCKADADGFCTLAAFTRYVRDNVAIDKLTEWSAACQHTVEGTSKSKSKSKSGAPPANQ